MNYLAHAFLSFDDPGLLIGNMISDFVKGKKQFDYSEEIQKGIRLHRMIDTFTDAHPATQEAKKILKPAVGPYAGAFIDVVYDHFLAIDNSIQSDEEWKDFAQQTYITLHEHEPLLPERFAKMLPYMSSQNWLYNYRYKWGIEKSFEGVVRRAAYLQDSSAAYQLFEDHYSLFQEAYHTFFPDVKKMAAGFSNAL
jgi:acyl carrier protein phosphodiesterase